jgi:5-methylcytosine-specific restriction protein A
MLEFTRGARYRRADVKERAGFPREAKGGNWDTGIAELDGEYVIFTNVGTEGRTGHDYGNRWEGAHLRWYHKNRSHLGWGSVRALLTGAPVIHVFWRTSNRDSFLYAGRARAIEVADTSPVEFLWAFDDVEQADVPVNSPEQVTGAVYREGAVRQVLVNAYERDRAARQACIDHYGPACCVCGLVFERRYGPTGSGFIHVHHVVPLSELGPDYHLNPIRDLRPTCPNCHAMLHRRRPPLEIEALRALLR